MKLFVLMRSSGYSMLSHSAKSSRIAYKYSSLDLNGRYDRASNRTVLAILLLSPIDLVNLSIKNYKIKTGNDLNNITIENYILFDFDGFHLP